MTARIAPTVVVLLLVGTGCPSPTAAPPAAATPCTRVGGQCSLPGQPGVLGVCEPANPGDPRFICQPQH
ncbi:hypothetical protein L6V77_16055 [Myxococcota bacterium]|nr:hypothetical protein [Myxococcota bacterium]